MFNHAIITGTGRCGTTALIRILTHLGLDTGFSIEEVNALKDAQPGLEFDPRLHPYEQMPYIIKSPIFCIDIRNYLSNKQMVIDHLFIPIRCLFQAAESRRRINKGDGGLTGTRSLKVGDQEEILLHRLYNLLLIASSKMIPVTFIKYPLLTVNSKYLYDKLKPILKDTKYTKFAEVFDQIIRPDLVHIYKPKGVDHYVIT